MIQNIISIIDEVLAIEGQSNAITVQIPKLFNEYGLKVLNDDFNFTDFINLIDKKEEDNPQFFETDNKGGYTSNVSVE